MRYSAILLTIGLTVCAASDCMGFQGAASTSSGFRYPRVYGPSGALYGPTQAHRQYQQRYGRPWHGSGGLTSGYSSGNTHFGFSNSAYYHQPSSRSFYFQNSPHLSYYDGYHNYPYSYGPQQYGYSGASPGFGNAIGFAYTPMAPHVLQGQPFWIGGNPSNNAVIRGALEEEQRRWQQPIDGQRKPRARRRLKPSTPDAKLRSIRLQARGDDWMRKQNYAQAYQRYKQAIDAAEDRADVHFRLGFALVAMKRFSLAVEAFKRGLMIDPSLPVTGDSLTKIYGPNNDLAKISFIHKASHWVRVDIRDPDRLFLLGLLLHFNDDSDRAGTLFETAYRLAGQGDHLLAFLNSVDSKAGNRPVAPPDPNAPQIPDAGGVPPKPAAPVIKPKVVIPPGAPPQKRLKTGRGDENVLKLPPLPAP